MRQTIDRSVPMVASHGMRGPRSEIFSQQKLSIVQMPSRKRAKKPRGQDRSYEPEPQRSCLADVARAAIPRC